MTRRPLKFDPPSLFHYPRIVPKFPQYQPFVAKCPHPGLKGLATAAPPNYRVVPLTISKLEAPEKTGVDNLPGSEWSRVEPSRDSEAQMPRTTGDPQGYD